MKKSLRLPISEDFGYPLKFTVMFFLQWLIFHSAESVTFNVHFGKKLKHIQFLLKWHWIKGNL